MFRTTAPSSTTAIHDSEAMRRSGRPLQTASLACALLLAFIGVSGPSRAEAQVLTQNLAAGKAANQSSTHEGAAAARAVDGNTSGAWLGGSVTHTQSNAKAWWQVDLGAVTLLGKVVLYNRVDCCSERLSNFVIQVSNDGNTWTQVGALAGTAPARSTYSFSAAGRFVRVQLQGTNFLSLAEAQVFPPQN